MYKVYVLVNKINGKMYVGYTSQTLSQRFNEHKCSFGTEKECNIHRVINEVGAGNFEIRMIEEYKIKQDAKNGEIEWTNYLDTVNFGYNTIVGSKQLFSAKTKEKLSLSRQRRTPMLGKIHSEKTKLQLSKSNSGEDWCKSKLTKQNVENIRNLYASGKYSYGTLSDKYNCTRQNIRSIVKFLSWKEV